MNCTHPQAFMKSKMCCFTVPKISTVGQGGPEGKKEVFLSGSFAKRPRVAHIFNHGWRRLAVGGGWRLAVGGGWWSLGAVLKGGP